MLKVQHTMSLILQHTLVMQQQRQQQLQQQKASIPVDAGSKDNVSNDKDKGSEKGYNHALAVVAR